MSSNRQREMMEPNQVVPEAQVPDENYIERLFPKCPPKQAANLNYGKRSQNNSKSSQSRRRTRSKVHQHSRRELEARRNKLNSNWKDNGTGSNISGPCNSNNTISSSSSNNNNLMVSSSQNNANSTESSDDNGTLRSRLKRSNSSGQHSSGLQAKPTGPSTASATGSGTARRSGKYTASQSLLQQLERSQSTHNNSVSARTQKERANASIEPQRQQRKADKAQESPNRGIVKSSSSFAFLNEQSTSNATCGSNHQVVDAEPKALKCRDQQVRDPAPRSMVASTAASDSGAREDKSQGDLFDNNNESKLVCKSILRASSKKEPQIRLPQHSNPKPKDNGAAAVTKGKVNDLRSEPPLDKLLSKIDKRNNRNSRAMDFAAATTENPVLPNPANVGPLAPCAPADNSVSSATKLTSADVDVRDSKLNHPIVKRNSNDDGRYISIPGDETILFDTNGPKEKLVALTDRGGSNESENTSNRKDDEKYINLFVYDSATNQTLQRSQIESSPPIVKKLTESSNSLANQDVRHATRRDANDATKTGHKPAYSSSPSPVTSGLIVEVEPSNLVAEQSKSGYCSSPPNSQRLTEEVEANAFEQNNKPLDINNNKTRNTIVSVQHRESQQLLVAADANDDAELVRNDASTEELCSVGDTTEESVDSLCNKREDLDSKLEPSQTISQRTQTNQRTSLTGLTGALQTVDESSEISPEELVNEYIETNTTDKKLLEEPTNEAMPATNPARKIFVPPGHPQRIRPQLSDNDDVGKSSSQTAPVSSNIIEAKQTKSVINGEFEKRPTSSVDPTTDQSDLRKDSPFEPRSSKSEGLRVKFNDENLVSIRSGYDSRIAHEGSYSERQHHNLSALLPSTPSPKQPPELPLPTPGSRALELETSNQQSHVDAHEKDLSSGLNRISLNNNSRSEEGEIPRDFLSESRVFQDSSTHEENHQPSYQSAEQIHVTPVISHSQHAVDTVIPNLQHHKLPNESSHYSLVRTTTPNSVSDTSNPIRSSSMQFNTLSDGESGPDESGGIPSAKLSSLNRQAAYTIVAKKCDRNSTLTSGAARNSSLPRTGQLAKQSSSTSNMTDDDLAPTTKTALIFPRLDEGLSSEAESGDDEIEDEDERAVDADVDADDDEDEDDDDDDDDDDDEDIDDGRAVNSSLPSNGRSSQALQVNNVDCFLRPQHQQSHFKPPGRVIGASHHQQQAHNSSMVGITAQSDQSNTHHAKGSNMAYGGYMNQDLLDNNDLKSMPNYSNQNGQSSSYWMDSPNQQQSNLSQQPNSSQNFNNRSHGSTSNISAKPNNNSFSRDEAKVTNRLSSDTDNETDRLLGSQRNDQLKSLADNDNLTSGGSNNASDLHPSGSALKQNSSSKEVLIEGVLFNVKYLGSTHSECEGHSDKHDRISQAEMAVQEVKFRNGDSQSATEVQLFISTEKIIVLEDKQRQIMMDHSLRTISYIADIGDAIVLIVRKKNSPSETNESGRLISKISCHVFESRESSTITKAISHAFQVAYAELLKANNGVGETLNHMLKDGLEYQEVLNSQEMSFDELEMFTRKENQREVIVPKKEGEILGISIVESGWGSLLPTVVISSMKPSSAAYKCTRLSIGDHILSVNGISLVGLPLSECQEILRRTKRQAATCLHIVPGTLTVKVTIKRPDIKYQLGFSVQNGVICSLLRGGIAERGGVRVGHRIMSINGTTVVNVPHDKIVNLLANSVGEIKMTTCLTSLVRQVTGQEKPVHL